TLCVPPRSWLKKNRSAIAVSTSGNSTGESTANRNCSRPLRRNRTWKIAAGVPTSVARNDTTIPTTIENRNASTNWPEEKNARNQRSESPVGGNDRYSAELSDTTTTIRVGRSRKA